MTTLSHRRLPNGVHTSRPWRIHALVAGFRLEDVWALPTPGGPEDFPRLVRQLAAYDPSRGGSAAVRALIAFRWKLGAAFGWDGAETGIGARVPSLADRLPAELRRTGSNIRFRGLPASPLYVLDDECAVELANSTVHAIVHIGWVASPSGAHRGEMAVYVKPNGRLGSLYMAAIRPFRYLIVYPRMLGDWGELWAHGGEAVRRDTSEKATA